MALLWHVLGVTAGVVGFATAVAQKWPCTRYAALKVSTNDDTTLGISNQRGTATASPNAKSMSHRHYTATWDLVESNPRVTLKSTGYNAALLRWLLRQRTPAFNSPPKVDTCYLPSCFEFLDLISEDHFDEWRYKQWKTDSEHSKIVL